MKSQLRKHLWFSRMVFALSLGLLFLPTGCANPSTSATPSASSPLCPVCPDFHGRWQLHGRWQHDHSASRPHSNTAW